MMTSKCDRDLNIVRFWSCSDAPPGLLCFFVPMIRALRSSLTPHPATICRPSGTFRFGLSASNHASRTEIPRCRRHDKMVAVRIFGVRQFIAAFWEVVCKRFRQAFRTRQLFCRPSGTHVLFFVRVFRALRSFVTPHPTICRPSGTSHFDVPSSKHTSRTEIPKCRRHGKMVAGGATTGTLVSPLPMRPERARESSRRLPPSQSLSPQIFFIKFHQSALQHRPVFFLKRFVSVVFFLVQNITVHALQISDAECKSPVSILPGKPSQIKSLFNPLRRFGFQFSHYIGQAMRWFQPKGQMNMVADPACCMRFPIDPFDNSAQIRVKTRSSRRGKPGFAIFCAEHDMIVKGIVSRWHQTKLESLAQMQRKCFGAWNDSVAPPGLVCSFVSVIRALRSSLTSHPATICRPSGTLRFDVPVPNHTSGTSHFDVPSSKHTSRTEIPKCRRHDQMVTGSETTGTSNTPPTMRPEGAREPFLTQPATNNKINIPSRIRSTRSRSLLPCLLTDPTLLTFAPNPVC